MTSEIVKETMKEVSMIITKEWNEEVIIHSTKKATTQL